MIDLYELADCHVHSFPNSHYNKFGRKFLIKSLSWYISNYKQRSMIIINHENELAGYLTMKDSGDSQNFLLYMVLPLVAAAIFHPLNFVRYILYPQIVSLFKKDTMYIPNNSLELVSIGVRPRLRGVGLGDKLLSEFESIAHGRGFKTIFLSVKKENREAISFYEKNGWSYSGNANGRYKLFIKEI